MVVAALLAKICYPVSVDFELAASLVDAVTGARHGTTIPADYRERARKNFSRIGAN